VGKGRAEPGRVGPAGGTAEPWGGGAAGRGPSEPGGAGLRKRDFGRNGLKVLNTGDSFLSSKPIPEAKSSRYYRLRIELRDFLDHIGFFAAGLAQLRPFSISE
jgi:hypothetical protein